MFSDVHWTGSISCYRSPTQPDTAHAKRSGFMKYVQQASCLPTGSITSSHQNGSRENEGLFLEECFSFMLSVVLHVCSKQHSRGACKAKLLIHVQEESNNVNWEKSKGAGSGACSAALPAHSRAAFYLRGAPKLVFDCVILTQADTSRLLSSLCSSSSSATFMCCFVGTLQVSSLNFYWSRNEKLSIFSARELSHLGEGAAEGSLRWWQPSWKGR